MLLLRLAWRNLWRGWRRSVVVMSAIAVGLCATLVLVGWSKGTMYQMRDNAIRSVLAHLAVQAAGYQADPDVRRNLGAGADRVIALLHTREGAYASARLRGEGLVQSARRSLRVSVIGVDPAAERGVSVVPDSLVDGEFLPVPRGRSSRQLPAIVIGQAMAERLRVDLGDKLVLHVPGEAGLGAFRVRGIYRTNSTDFDRSVAYMRLAVAQNLFAVEGPTEVAVALDRPDEARDLQAWLRERTDAARIEVLRWQERQPVLASLIDYAGSIYWIFYVVVFVAMAFGIANALLMSVYERIREFGVLRSLGLKSTRLVVLVLLESVLLTLAGTGLGLGIGLPLIGWLGHVGIDLSRFASALEGYGIGTTIYPAVELGDTFWPVGLALVTALIAAFWPALKAARLRPAEALRAS